MMNEVDKTDELLTASPRTHVVLTCAPLFVKQKIDDVGEDDGHNDGHRVEDDE